MLDASGGDEIALRNSSRFSAAEDLAAHYLDGRYPGLVLDIGVGNFARAKYDLRDRILSRLHDYPAMISALDNYFEDRCDRTLDNIVVAARLAGII